MRNRTGTVEVLTPPPAPQVLEVEDPERDDRLRRVLELLACGTPDTSIWRSLQREYAVTLPQAKADYADVRDRVRQHLDSDGAVDGVMLGAMARLQGLIQRFHNLALTEIPERTLEVPGADPDSPENGAIYRPLSSGERASEIGARVAAGGLALKANTALTQLVGRRSQRWADKPSTVLQINTIGNLSIEDQALLRSLGMAQ